jgi:dienelactone hydrolase
VPTTRDVDYEVDGTTMVGRLALPDGDGPRPGVLLAHEGPGLDDYQRERAARFAELGYVAFALDYHGGGQVLMDRTVMNERLATLWERPELTRALGRAGLDVLIGEARTDAERVVAVGYCYGGAVVLELARDGADLKAVVGMHPRLSTVRPQDARNIRGKVLVAVGTADPFIPVEERQAFADEMDAAGVDWQLHLYGGVGHSFTHPWVDRVAIRGLAYDEQADTRSWRAMLDLFESVVGWR